VRRRQRGFTLVEGMVSLAILAIITLAMGGTFLVAYRAISTEARVIAADEAVSGASLWLTRDLNSASVLPTGTADATPSSVSFSYGSPPAINVVYSVNANHDLVRTVNGQAGTAARGISSVNFSAVGCYAAVVIQPSATGAAAVTLNVSNRPAGCF